MPYPNKRCEFCGDLVTNGNYRRHLRRWHTEESVGQETPLRTPSRDSTPSSDSRHPTTEPSFRSLFADYVRDATLCMLRRQDGNNVPMMSNYLSYYFSDIPVNMHIPIIVATFTAAQKVAATHGDTLLSGDDEKTSWARRSLARWMHGLSGVEKRFSNDVESFDRVSRDTTPECLPKSSLPQNQSATGNRNRSEVFEFAPAVVSPSPVQCGSDDDGNVASTNTRFSPMPKPFGEKDDDLLDKSGDTSMNARPTPSPVSKSFSGEDGDHSKDLDALSAVVHMTLARPSPAQEPLEERNGNRSDKPIVPKLPGGSDDVPPVKPGTSSTEKVVLVEDSDVEPGGNHEDPTRLSNVFVSHSLPVPLKSTFAQADVKAALSEAVSNSSAIPSLFDRGPDQVIVLDAEPDIDLLLQNDPSSTVPPTMPNFFDDMILDEECGTISSELLRPLSMLVTPLSTPKVDRSRSDGNNIPINIDLFPQPHPSIEDEASSSGLQTEPVSKIGNEIKEGKL